MINSAIQHRHHPLTIALVAAIALIKTNAQHSIPPAYMGQGFCSSGFLRGTDGVWTVDSCLNACASEDDCFAISVVEGNNGRCSRYSSTADCYNRENGTAGARSHRTYDFPHRTSPLWPFVGGGHCDSGFLRGSDGYYTVESCMALCHNEDDCHFISVVQGTGGRCSRYGSSTDCTNRRETTVNQRAHTSYRNPDRAAFRQNPELIPQAYMGTGYCSSGFLRGTDGAWTVNTCLAQCESEPDCFAISVVAGENGRCSRYSSTADCLTRVTVGTSANLHRTYDFPFRTSNLWPRVGEGFCAEGFLRGANGYFTVESCMALCHNEADCFFISVVEGEGGRCSRYSKDTMCSNRNDQSDGERAHTSYRNCSAVCKGLSISSKRQCKKQGKKLACSCKAKVIAGGLECSAA